MDRFIGRSESLQKALTEAKCIAKSNAPVILIGETGVGKELFADYIYNESTRKNAPFVKVNCAAIQDTLLESDLFGHEKGAFTGAYTKKIGKLQTAHTGTIFLDEISNMSLAIQAKILRALEYQQFEPVGGNTTIKVDIRIISATNKNLGPLIENGKFRSDLFFRLGVMVINIPPLRSRENDIILLARHFAKSFKIKYEKNITSVSNAATKLLLGYHWPGNIRELRNVMERAVLFCEQPEIAEEHIHVKNYLETSGLENHDGSRNIMEYAIDRLRTNGYYGKMAEALDELEKLWMIRALEENNYIQKDAAKDLGISTRMVCYKMDNLGLKCKSPHGSTKNIKRKPVTEKESNHGL